MFSVIFSPRKISLVIAALSLASTGKAQDRVLEEVVVTAQKRAESAQEVPLGMSAMTGEMLANAGISRTADLVQLTPSLTVVEDQNRQSSSFSIRGVGTNVFSIGVENSVAVVIDDVSTVQAGQSLANLADIERVEVLRGPQSTLFGKSASAGLINVTTAAPANTLERTIELSVTDDGEQRANASISGPLTDNFGYRFSAYWSDLDGYIDNLSNGEEQNDTETRGGRMKLRWDINSSVQADLNVYYNSDKSTCCAYTWSELSPQARVFGIIPQAIAAGITPGTENRDVRNDVIADSDSDNRGVNLRFIAELGEYTLTAITAYDNWEYANAQDVDQSDIDILGLFSSGSLSGGFRSDSVVDSDFFSQELRLTSPAKDHYDYLLGLYYADAETDRQFLRNQGLPILAADWNATASTETLALFAHINWHLSDQLRLSFGIRWNEEEIAVSYDDNLAPGAAAITGSDTDSEVLGNVSLQYFMQEDVMLYVRYSQGYKGQAYNVVTNFTQADADSAVAPETSDAFELGLKSTWWDQRLQLNAALFYSEYQDFQAQNTIIEADGNFINSLRNVGELETQGLELDGIALLGDNLTLSFGATYLDTEIKRFDGAPCYPGQTIDTGCINGLQDLAGAALPNAPEWKYNLGADYHVPLHELPFDGFITLAYTWQDEVNFDIKQNPLTIEGDYGTANFSIGISERDSDAYRLTLFVNNLTDESYRANLLDARALFGGQTAVSQILPRGSQRYFGIRAKVNL